MKLDISEKQLIEMYISGDNESIAIIYMKHWRLFLNVSKKYICHKEDCEDLVHNVIEKLLMFSTEKRNKLFSNVNSLSSFFYIIIKNASLDYLKKKKITTLSYEVILEPINIDDEKHLNLDYLKVGLSKVEMLCFEEYLIGHKPLIISKNLNKNLYTVKNTLQNAKKKIIKYYKVNNRFLD